MPPPPKPPLDEALHEYAAKSATFPFGPKTVVRNCFLLSSSKGFPRLLCRPSSKGYTSTPSPGTGLRVSPPQPGDQRVGLLPQRLRQRRARHFHSLDVADPLPAPVRFSARAASS